MLVTNDTSLLNNSGICGLQIVSDHNHLRKIPASLHLFASLILVATDAWLFFLTNLVLFPATSSKSKISNSIQKTRKTFYV